MTRTLATSLGGRDRLLSSFLGDASFGWPSSGLGGGTHVLYRLPQVQAPEAAWDAQAPALPWSSLHLQGTPSAPGPVVPQRSRT